MRRLGLVLPLVLTAACTSSDPDADRAALLGAPSPAPIEDGGSDVRDDFTLDTMPEAADSTATNDGLPPAVPVSPSGPTSDDDTSLPGTCGAPATDPLPPIVAPTCVARERGWRKIAQPGDLAKGVGFHDTAGGYPAFTGTEVLLLGDVSAPAQPVALAYNVVTDTWRKLPKPPSEHWNALFAKGLWYTALRGSFEDGAERPMSVDVYDPATDAWSTLPPAPIVERRAAAMEWSTTTNELIIWGGKRAGWKGYSVDEIDLADGAAWNPTTRTWRILAAAPLKGRFVVASAWDGEHLVIAHAGRDVSDGSYPVSRAAIYDPRADAWTKVCDPPVSSKRIARVGINIGATGELALLWGGWPGHFGDGDGDPDFQDGSIFVRSSRSWRVLPKPPVEGEWDLALRWTAGGKLWSWGRPVAPGVTGGVVYDPATNKWTTISDLWGPPAAGNTSVWTGCDLVALTDSGWASLRPE